MSYRKMGGGMRRLPGLSGRVSGLVTVVGIGFALLLLAARLSPGCSQGDSAGSREQPGGRPWFEDVTEACGLDFVHDAGPVGTYFMPQIMGSGAALFDFDGDGRLDIYLVQNRGPQSDATNRLFHQEKDGRF